MATMMAGPALSISPSELSFPVELFAETHITLHLENVSSTECAAFKVKTNASQKYYVQPPSGLLPPGGSTDVKLIMVAQAEQPLSVETRDKFLVQAVQMPRGATEADVPLNLKDLGVPVHEARLSVKHVTPAAPSPASELASDAGQSAGRASADTSGREDPSTSASHPAPAASAPHANGISEAGVATESRETAGAPLQQQQQHEQVKAELESATAELERLRGSALRQAQEAEAAIAQLRSELEEERRGREDERQQQLRLHAEELQRVQEAVLEKEERARLEGQRAAQELEEEVEELKGQLAQRETEVAKLRRGLELSFGQLKEKEDALLRLQQARELEESSKEGTGAGAETRAAAGEDSASACSVAEHETLQAAYEEATATVERLRREAEESESTKAAALSTLSAVQVDLELTSKRSVRLKEDLELALRDGDRLRNQLQKLQSSSSSSQQATGKSAQVTTDEEHWRRQMELENVRRENAATIAAIEELRAHSEDCLREKNALEEVLAKLEITDARHPQHSLKLVPIASSLSSTFQCSACLRKGRGWLWECMGPACDYSLHLHCSTINTGMDPRLSSAEGRNSWSRGKDV